MSITSLEEVIQHQTLINQYLVNSGIRDLVGDYGELLVQKAFGGLKQNAVNQGYDIKHDVYGRIEVKTRQYELKKDGKIKKENRAVGFSGKEGQFDWLAHVVLNTDFTVAGACMVKYDDAWPEIQRTSGKIGYSTSSKLASSIDITEYLKIAQIELNNSI